MVNKLVRLSMKWSCDVRSGKYIRTTPQWFGPVMSHNKLKYCISSCRKSMDSKLGKVLTYLGRLSFLKSLDQLITWPTWCHAKSWKNISPLSQGLWALNLTWCWLLRVDSARKRLSCCSVTWHLIWTIIFLRKLHQRCLIPS